MRSNTGGRYVHDHSFLSLVDGYLLRLDIQSSRFARVSRPYTAQQVVAKRGTIQINYPSDIQAKKLWRILSEHAKNGTPSHTYGA